MTLNRKLAAVVCLAAAAVTAGAAEAAPFQVKTTSTGAVMPQTFYAPDATSAYVKFLNLLVKTTAANVAVKSWCVRNRSTHKITNLETDRASYGHDLRMVGVAKPGC